MIGKDYFNRALDSVAVAILLVLTYSFVRMLVAPTIGGQ